jgi:hypothetical protein
MLLNPSSAEGLRFVFLEKITRVGGILALQSYLYPCVRTLRPWRAVRHSRLLRSRSRQHQASWAAPCTPSRSPFASRVAWISTPLLLHSCKPLAETMAAAPPDPLPIAESFTETVKGYYESA